MAYVIPVEIACQVKSSVGQGAPGSILSYRDGVAGGRVTRPDVVVVYTPGEPVKQSSVRSAVHKRGQT